MNDRYTMDIAAGYTAKTASLTVAALNGAVRVRER
jgi:hypothetical protein